MTNPSQFSRLQEMVANQIMDNTVEFSKAEQAASAITLDSTDPFERVLAQIVETNRRKRKDYASDGDIFSNFHTTSHFAGFESPWMSALFNCSQKLARITSLRSNGRLNDPANEAVEDTLLDNAVYGVIAYAIFRQEADKYAEDATVSE